MDWCYYLATNVLSMSEEEFLKCTPRKLFKLADIHKRIHSSEDEESASIQQKSEEDFVNNIF